MESKSQAMTKATPTARQIPLRVICPALSRNGTDSMRKALEIVGMGRTFHGFRLAENPAAMESWVDLLDKKYPQSNSPGDVSEIQAHDFDKVIGDCGAVTDMPCAAFWRELMTAYPDAQIILIERDIDTWFQSFDQVVVQGMMSRKGQLFANPLIAAFVGDRMIEMMFRVFLNYFHASNRTEMAANAKRVYQEHNAAVRKACRDENRELLEYRLGDGWQPLCDFLKVPVPHNTPFPRGNETRSMTELTHMIQRQRVVSLAQMLMRRMVFVAISLTSVWAVGRKLAVRLPWVRMIQGWSGVAK